MEAFTGELFKLFYLVINTIIKQGVYRVIHEPGREENDVVRVQSPFGEG